MRKTRRKKEECEGRKEKGTFLMEFRIYFHQWFRTSGNMSADIR
jgi:hypothetical protein